MEEEAVERMGEGEEGREEEEEGKEGRERCGERDSELMSKLII